jgi:hypothetical protein
VPPLAQVLVTCIEYPRLLELHVIRVGNVSRTGNVLGINVYLSPEPSRFFVSGLCVVGLIRFSGPAYMPTQKFHSIC